MQIYAAVSCLQPATFDKLVAQAVPATGAHKWSLSTVAQLVHGRRHSDNLEHRSGRIGSLGPAADERTVGIVVKLGPGLLINAGDKEAGIETRIAGHGQHEAGIGIKNHNGPRSIAQNAFGVSLQPPVDGRINAATGSGEGFCHLGYFPMMLSQSHQSPAAPAGQVRLTPSLHPSQSYQFVASVAA